MSLIISPESDKEARLHSWGGRNCPLPAGRGWLSSCDHAHREFHGSTIGRAPIKFPDTGNSLPVCFLKSYGGGIYTFLSHIASIAS